MLLAPRELPVIKGDTNMDLAELALEALKRLELSNADKRQVMSWLDEMEKTAK